MQTENNRYFPKSTSVKINLKDLPVTIGLYETTAKSGKPVFGFIAYSGKRSKHDRFEAHRNEQARQAAVEQYIADFKAAAARKLREKEKHKVTHNPFKPGDILDYSWGYDQTNWEFFQVVEVKALAVKIREIKQMIARDCSEYMANYVVPSPNDFSENGETITKRVQMYEGRAFVSMKHGSADLWDGKAKYATYYA